MDTFGKLYDKCFSSFKKTGLKFKDFAILYPEALELYSGNVWNVRLFGKPTDKYSF